MKQKYNAVWIGDNWVINSLSSESGTLKRGVKNALVNCLTYIDNNFHLRPKRDLSFEALAY